MNAADKILNYLINTEKTLVFTSETAARNAVMLAVERCPGKAVFSDRAMSWDSFYLTLLDTGGKREVTRTERKIFSYSFLKNGGLERMKSLASPRYPESTLAYSSSIASLLPFLPSPDDTMRPLVSQDTLGDMDLLRSSYLNFLEERRLYEKNYLEPDCTKVNAESFVFVFPPAFRTTRADEVMEKCGIERIDIDPDAEKSEFIEYPNAISEIRWTLRHIEEDRKEYSDDEIALTSSSLSTYRPYLESEAKKRGIPLVFTSSSPLSSYSEGRFLKELNLCVSSLWSFRETKKLLLDPRYPFKGRDLLVSMIRHCVDRKMEDKGTGSWLKVLTGEEKEYFLSLTRMAERIVKSRRPSLTIHWIREFRDSFFEEGAWNEEEDRVFGSLLDILGSFDETETDDLYRLFLSLADETEYVERSDEKNGIRVYSYPASCGLMTKVHYVIGLDDRTTETKTDDYPYIVSLSRPDVPDMTQSILGLYACRIFTEKTVLSGTKDGFDGARLLPPIFLDSAKKNSEDGSDGYIAEHELWIHGFTSDRKPYPEQAEGYRKALNTSLCGREASVSVLPFTREERSISVSRMKDYDLCPYRGYASDRLHLKKKEYTIKTEDPIVIGEILHSTIERTLEESRTISDIDDEVLRMNFISELETARKRGKIPAGYSYCHIKGRFYDILDSVRTSPKASFFDKYSLLANERKAEGYRLTGNLTLNGRIDTLLINEETGDAFIIDWKTTGKNDWSGDLKEISLQVILYAVLLEDDESVSVKGGAFYSFSEGNYRMIWPGVEYLMKNGRKAPEKEGFDETLLKTEIRERLDRIKDALETGSFTPAYTDNSCIQCDYPRLCRALFAASMEKKS